MDLHILRNIFLWCTIINGGILLASSFICMFCADFAYRMNHQYFGITRDTFNTTIFAFIAFYKVIVITFNITPYLALLILA